jgi:hypothetical protein
LQDLGPSAFGLQAPAGQRFFLTAPDQLTDGYSELDQYLMGLRRAAEVSPFWYVDTPGDPYDGRSLDYAAYLPPFSPSRFFRGTRVDLTIQDVQAHPAMGPRFWGPSGPLTLAYDDSGRVVPGGSHHVTLTEDDRRLGDEADAIDAQGKPVDVRSMAFILLVRDDPSNHQTAIRQMDTFRRTWESYANGPATGSRGRFSASLRPLLH